MGVSPSYEACVMYVCGGTSEPWGMWGWLRPSHGACEGGYVQVMRHMRGGVSKSWACGGWGARPSHGACVWLEDNVE